MSSGWPPLIEYLSLPLPPPRAQAPDDNPRCPSELRFFFTYLTYDTATGTYPTDRHLSALGTNDYVFLLLSWHRMGFDKSRLRAMQGLPCTCIICANTEEEWAELQEAGVRCILFNQNALVDERIFSQRAQGTMIRETSHGLSQQLDALTAQPIVQASTATANLLIRAPQDQTVRSNAASSLLGCDGDGRCWDLVVNSSLAEYKRLHLAGAVVKRVHIGIPVAGLACVLPPSHDLLLNRQTVHEHHTDGSSHSGSGSCVGSSGSRGGGSGGSGSGSRFDGLSGSGSGDGHGNSSVDGSSRRTESSSGKGSSICKGLVSACVHEATQAARYRYLSPAEVCDVLNQSKVGGIFSAEEGTCYACTEYLFAGLPVVTTPSRGGRHVWLNSSNSITVKACCNAVECKCGDDSSGNTDSPKQAVAEAVACAVTALNSGMFDRSKIREDAISMAWKFRNTLISEVQAILDEYGLAEVMDAKEHFRKTFTHKLQRQPLE